MRKKKQITQKICITIFLMVIFLLIFLTPKLQVMANKPYVIVIDPGHGGENLGAEHYGYTEKDLNLIVAKAMKEELERYDNVTVYLTHETDEDMSIKARAEFGKEKNADLLLSLHFNASVHHNLYGTEIWIPAYDDFYVNGRTFAEIEMDLLTAKGLYSRGIKTKLNDENKDYYGILRHCSALGINSVLIEHCHMDHENDLSYYQDDEEKLISFGKTDATAVARYLRLSSEELGVDYSDFELPKVFSPKEGIPVKPDKTEPEQNRIELLFIDENSGEITLHMRANDKDSYIQYFSYSTDGGKTFTDLLKWPRLKWNLSEVEHEFQIPAKEGDELKIVTRAYNGFDAYTESNLLKVTIPVRYQSVQSDAVILSQTEYEEVENDTFLSSIIPTGLSIQDKITLLIQILLISSFMTLIFYLMIRMIFLLVQDNRRNKEQ